MVCLKFQKKLLNKKKGWIQTMENKLLRQELKNKLLLLGYKCKDSENGYINVLDSDSNTLVATINNSKCNLVEFNDKNSKVLKVYELVKEYVLAYEKAKVIKDFANKDYLTLIKWNDVVLCAKVLLNDSFEFVTWINDKNDFYSGNYFVDFYNAKKDFVFRSNLLNINDFKKEDEGEE